MALGTSILNELRHDEETILDICNNQMPISFATFDFVLKSLDSWADDTTVGYDLRNELSKYTSWVREFNEKTKQLCTSMEEFIQAQEAINSTDNY